MLCKLTALAAMLTLCSLSAKSQYYFYDHRYYDAELVFEIGGSVGGMNCLTDLGGKNGPGKKFIKDLNYSTTQPAVSLYGLMFYKQAIAVRLEGTFGSVTAYDSIIKTPGSSNGRYERNLSFKSSITEAQLSIEVHPLFFKEYDEGESPYISPYFVFGIGAFNFNPQAKLNNNWYHLHPLRLEGQGFKEYPDSRDYSLTQVCVPIGAGVKYDVSPLINARVEFLYRILSTDYLDDVSTNYIDPDLFIGYLHPEDAEIAKQLYNRQTTTPQSKPGEKRGNPGAKDTYFSLQFKIGFVIGRKSY